MSEIISSVVRVFASFVALGLVPICAFWMQVHAWELIDDFDIDNKEVSEFHLNGRMVVVTLAYFGTCVATSMYLGLAGVYVLLILTFLMYYAGHKLADYLMGRVDSVDGDHFGQSVVVFSVYVVLDVVLFSIAWGILRVITST